MSFLFLKFPIGTDNFPVRRNTAMRVVEAVHRQCPPDLHLRIWAMKFLPIMLSLKYDEILHSQPHRGELSYI